MADYRTALGRARGLGSAKTGVGHFIGQRVSGVAIIFLALWGAWSALDLAKGGYDGARAWLGSPINAALLILLAVAGFYHVQLGVRTIIEDYVGSALAKTALLIANAFLCFGAAAVTAVCLLKVALGGGAI